jgi:hypothetical protein
MVEEKNQQEQQQIQLNLSTIFREKISIFLCMYVCICIYIYIYVYLSGISLYHVTASRSDMLKVFLPPEISNKEFQNQLH